MEKPDQTSSLRRGHAAAGLTVSGSLLTGAMGIVGGFAAALSGDFIGGGIFLIAAAAAFGLLANAIYRH